MILSSCYFIIQLKLKKRQTNLVLLEWVNNNRRHSLLKT